MLLSRSFIFKALAFSLSFRNEDLGLGVAFYASFLLSGSSVLFGRELGFPLFLLLEGGPGKLLPWPPNLIL